MLFFSDASFSYLCLALKMALRHWKADIGILPPTEKQLQQDFHVSSLPALRLVFVDHKKEKDKQVFGQNYEGPMEFGSMRAFLEAVFITLKTEKTGQSYLTPSLPTYNAGLKTDTDFTE